MHRRTAFLILAGALAPLGCSHAPPHTSSVVQQGTRFDPGYSINAPELRRDLFIFADDSFRGRETGTADAQRAAAFLARRAQLLGLEPAGDSLYMQRVPLVRQVFTKATHVAVTVSHGREHELHLGADYAPVLTLGQGQSDAKRNVDGEMIFVGYAPTNEAESDALARFDLEGKILVALHGAPSKTRKDQVRNLESQRVLTERVNRLIALHPAGIMLLMTGGAEQLYEQTSPRLLHPVVLDRPGEHPEDATSDSTRGLPVILLGVARRGSPLLPSGWPNDVTTQALGRNLSVHLDIERQPFTGYNVAAVLRGSDPKLNKTYLMYGAHYDHIGVVAARRPARRAKVDTIANGANDDASGSVALLAIARQMSYLRPRRSVLFIWHIGSEKGLLGSSYFTAHPTVPMDSIVTEFNAEAIAGTGENTVSLIGPRAAPNYLSWRVGMVVDSVNRALMTPFHIDRQWDDPDDPDNVYERGDQYNYAKRAIPVILFSTPWEGDHASTLDQPQKIEYDKLARVAELMLESGFAVANRSTRPTSEAVTQSISSRQH
jgi:hypothetical protein